MTITPDDLQDFTRFADEKLQNGGADSIAQLAADWEASRDLADSIQRLKQSEADIEAGRIRPLNEAFADVHERLRELK